MIAAYFSSHSPAAFVNALPGNIAQGILWGIMALGVYITFRLLDFADLTVDGSMATGGAVTVMLTIAGVPVALALTIAVISGALAGLVTGLLHTKLGIPPILAGILSQIGLYSINLNILGGANQAISVDKYPLILSLRKVSQSIVIALIFVAIIIAIMYWFFGTEIGCSIRATGSNEDMVRAQGVNTDLTKIMGFMLANGLVALSGSLICQSQGSAIVTMGQGAIVTGLASIVIGEVFTGNKSNFAFRMAMVVIGSIIYRLVVAIVLQLGLTTDDLKLFQAIIVAVALTAPYVMNRRKQKNAYLKEMKNYASNK
ncbi:MAG: ABC transporter permease [Erysipelotrichaceae bacterium]|nr:ABC transporter permease [Erysipelotrichaceae bacterium]